MFDLKKGSCRIESVVALTKTSLNLEPGNTQALCEGPLLASPVHGAAAQTAPFAQELFWSTGTTMGAAAELTAHSKTSSLWQHLHLH